MFHQQGGIKFRDAITMRSLDHILISDSLKLLFEENHITGWRSYPVVVYDKKGNQIPGYNGFTVTGRGGKMNYLKDKKDLPYDKSRTQFIQWEQSQWDGSDFFGVKPLYILATSRVKKVFKSAKIKGVSLTPLEEEGTII